LAKSRSGSFIEEKGKVTKKNIRRDGKKKGGGRKVDQGRYSFPECLGKEKEDGTSLLAEGREKVRRGRLNCHPLWWTQGRGGGGGTRLSPLDEKKGED